MDEEIEDIVGEVRYTDSQKSVATTNIYTVDFTDVTSTSASDKNTLSGQDTYVIDRDSEDSGGSIPLHEAMSLATLHEMTIPLNSLSSEDKACEIVMHNACTSAYQHVIAHETYTQTSKTIMQLAESDADTRRLNQNKSLETQTSFVSITENKTVEYRIEVSNAHQNFTAREVLNNGTRITAKPAYYNITCNPFFTESLEEASSKQPASVSESFDDVNNIENETPLSVDEDFENVLNSDNFEVTSEIPSDSEPEMEDDSLATPSPTNKESKSDEIEILHQHLSEAEDIEMPVPDSFGEPDIRRFGALTPLTEESGNKRENLYDVTPINNIVTKQEDTPSNDELIFTNNAGLKVKLFREGLAKSGKEPFRLPPIQNQSCPNSPHLNSLFSNKQNKLSKAGTLPCLVEGGRRESVPDRWEIGTKGLASGESTLICGRNDELKKCNTVQLPPIHAEGHTITAVRAVSNIKTKAPPNDQDCISVKEKIKELKLSTYNSRSRSNSPGSCTPEDLKFSDIADRGCDALCLELLKKLRSSDWVEVMETLDELTSTMQRFWHVATETRIADIIRQVNLHIESPRPQVARSACAAIAGVMKCTNYTKKPDFYETMTILLIKTGSYSRPLRRAANVALDDIVCGVELSLAVNALCVHGASHKSGLVRCATARLLVVCCALSAGGRELLRSRPTSAAAARRNALRSMSALLEDKSTDVRKYAERLYSMLRPLPNFEAYYLTDVDTEVATRQIKKFDQILCGPTKESR